MRIPEKGEAVLFYQNGDTSSPPSAAIVLDRSGDDLAVGVMCKHLNHQMTKDGVRHISRMEKTPLPIRTACGAWDYSPRERAIDAAINALSNRLEELEGEATEPEDQSADADAIKQKRLDNLAKARAAKANKNPETVA